MRLIARLKNRKKDESPDVISGYERLAFGCSADAIGILFEKDVTREMLQEMDLFNVSEFKKAANGAVEVRFFDRQKALDRLWECAAEKNEDAAGLYEAISRASRGLEDDDVFS